MADGKRMVAFAIGVGDAQRLPSLGGAVNGARQFTEWVSKLGYTARLVIDDPQPVTIERLRSELMAELEVRTPSISRLIIYFAGHGLIREAEEGLWLLSDWNTQLRAVDVEKLKRRLFRFNVGQIAIFSDSCRSLPSDIDAADLAPDPVLGLGPNPRSDPPIDKFIAAQDGSATFMVPGNTPDEDRCLFSGVLMEGLWGLNRGVFSRSMPDKVTSQSLGTFLKKEVPRRAATYGHEVSASISPTFPEGDDIYFVDGGLITPPVIPQWPLGEAARASQGFDQYQVKSADDGVMDSVSDQTRQYFRIRKYPPLDLPSPVSKPKLKRSLVGQHGKGQLLLQKIRRQTRPEKFETRSGFAVEGAAIQNFWTTADVFAESHREANWWRVGHRLSYELRSSVPVLIEFADGTFGALTALPQFIATVLHEPRGVTAIIYRKIGEPPAVAAASEKAVALLESGTLRANAATNLAADIRQWKHRDPVLGVISAYLYDSIGDVESIRRMAYFYVRNNQPIPYDIALLGQLRGVRRKDGLLSVLVPAVAARKPRTSEEKKYDWTHSATPTVTGEVGGLWPWMRQGWSYLDDPDDNGSTLIHPGLAELSGNLTKSRFATMDDKGGHRLAEMFKLARQPARGPEREQRSLSR